MLITLASSGRLRAAATRASAALARAGMSPPLRSSSMNWKPPVGLSPRIGGRPNANENASGTACKLRLRLAENGLDLCLLAVALVPRLQRGDQRRDVGVRCSSRNIESAEDEIRVNTPAAGW